MYRQRRISVNSKWYSHSTISPVYDESISLLFLAVNAPHQRQMHTLHILQTECTVISCKGLRLHYQRIRQTHLRRSKQNNYRLIFAVKNIIRFSARFSCVIVFLFSRAFFISYKKQFKTCAALDVTDYTMKKAVADSNTSAIIVNFLRHRGLLRSQNKNAAISHRSHFTFIKRIKRKNELIPVCIGKNIRPQRICIFNVSDYDVFHLTIFGNIPNFLTAVY